MTKNLYSVKIIIGSGNCKIDRVKSNFTNLICLTPILNLDKDTTYDVIV